MNLPPGCTSQQIDQHFSDGPLCCERCSSLYHGDLCPACARHDYDNLLVQMDCINDLMKITKGQDLFALMNDRIEVWSKIESIKNKFNGHVPE